jgi:hypothetical protein
MEQKMFRGEGPNNASCQMVEKITDEKINGLKDRVKASEHDIRELKDGVDGHLDELREEVQKGYHDLSKQLLQRVPAWVMTMMMTGASIIGAMAMWILDHLKR